MIVQSIILYHTSFSNQPAVLWIRDVYPGSRILIFTHPGSRITDPGSQNATKARGEKKFESIFKELYNFLPKNLSLSSQKYGFGIRDPRSGKNLFRIPDPGVKKTPDPGSATLPTRLHFLCYGVAWLNLLACLPATTMQVPGLNLYPTPLGGLFSEQQRWR